MTNQFFPKPNRLSRFERMRLIVPALLLLCIMQATTKLYAQSWSGAGDGTENNPYQISTSDELSEFREHINAGRFQTAHWRLENDIEWENPGSSNWFYGHFDGQGHTVSFNHIDRSSSTNVGFFNVISNCIIQNLTIKADYINGYSNVGGLVGWIAGDATIHNVHVRLKVTSNIYGTWAWGGLIGFLYISGGGTVNISNCSVIVNSVIFNASLECAGGLIGAIDLGQTDVNITDCMANVNFTLNENQHVGGLIGYSASPRTVTVRRTVVRSSGITDLGSSKNRGAVVGHVLNTNTLNLRAVYNNLTNTISGGMVGYQSSGTVNTTNVSMVTSWANNNNVYELLERRDDDGNTLSGNTRGAEAWGYDSDNTPMPSKTAYAVRVQRGSGVKNITGENFVSDVQHYVNADRTLTVTSDFTRAPHQRIIYTFTSDYDHSAGAANNYAASMDGDNWLLTARVNGSVSATIEDIPYPIGVSTDFKPRETPDIITISWNYSNPQNLLGRFYVYHREGASGSWGAPIEYLPVTAVTGIADASVIHTITNADLNKSFQYLIVFVEGDAPPAPLNPETEVNAIFRASVTCSTEIEMTNEIDMSENSPLPIGVGWTYANNVYTVHDGANVVIVGESANRRIEVATEAKNVNITLYNANISSGQSPLSIGAGAELSLALVGSNTLSAGGSNAGIHAPEGVALVIAGAGSLEALGSDGGAGIGGGANESGGVITINGGAVTATGGDDASGIGGGNRGAGGVITINGGTITANGGSNGAGIGGGNGSVGAGGTIIINGGTIRAVGGDNAAGIGGNNTAPTGSFTINGNAIIFASSVSDTNTSIRTGGILFIIEANAIGTFYGANVAMTGDAEIPTGYSLTIPAEATFTIPAGITLTNNGMITDEGTIHIYGVLTGNRISFGNGGGRSETATYSPDGIDLASLSLFTINKNAGTPTYTIEAGSTGVGTIEGTNLTVSKSGEFIIGLVTDATAHYAAGARVTSRLAVEKAPPSSVIFPTANGITYSPEQKLSDIPLIGGSGDGSFAWLNGYETPVVNNSGYTVIFTPADANNYTTETEVVALSVAKRVGAALESRPTPQSVTHNSITVNTISPPATGQPVEYAIRERINRPPDTGWQPGRIFSGLKSDELYYIFARAAENDNYFAGVAGISDAIMTDITTGNGDILQTSPLRAWVREGRLHVSGLVAGAVWSMYSISGVLAYSSVASGEEAVIDLPAPGVYIIQSDKNTVKLTINN